MIVRIEGAVPRHHLRYRGAERCALLVGHVTEDGYTVRRIVPIPNRSNDPVLNFDVIMEDAKSLLGSMVSDVIGVIHSHPHGDTIPSVNDLEQIGPDYIGAVFCGNTITAWYMRNRPLHDIRVEFPMREWAVSA